MSLVETTCGQIRGAISPSGVSVYKGVRFATAERLEPPVLVTQWSGVLEALTIGPECPQTESQLRQLLNADESGQSEDCLFLNITTPKANGSLRPVYVWIHGGGFTNITPPLSWNESERLTLDGDAVVVTLSYRLGAFGFLGNQNLGILDQIAALQWVQSNISAFGGDPQQVTICGQSAGGCSVIALMAAPSANGLFSRAWAMSPSLGQLRSPELAAKSQERFLQVANAASMEDLKQLTTEEFLQVQNAMLTDVETWLQGFSPTADGTVLAQDVVSAAANNPIDLVIGTTRDESRIFNLLNPALNNLDQPQALAVLQTNHGNQANDIYSLYSSCFPEFSPTQIIAAVDTDTHFKLHMWKLLNERAQTLTNTWSYMFTWSSPIFDGALGASHGLDIPFIFNNVESQRVHVYTGNDPSAPELAKEMSRELIALGNTGRPNWAPYDLINRNVKIFDVPTRVLHANDETPDNLVYNFWMQS
jgi:para-nitrobenzyl esterase